MSRLVLRRDDTYEVTVGYDDPLDTYFAQVLDVKASDQADDDVYLLLTGRTPGEITSVDEVLASVEQYAPCPPGAEGDLLRVKANLHADRLNRRQPTTFQRETFTRLTGKELP